MEQDRVKRCISGTTIFELGDNAEIKALKIYSKARDIKKRKQ